MKPNRSDETLEQRIARKLSEQEKHYALSGEKLVGYAYPTSSLADAVGWGGLGCYFVLADGHEPRLFPGDGRREAFTHADSIGLPYHKYSQL